MKQLTALTVAMGRGFTRDRMTVFWSVIFPLMFLVMFGGILTDRGTARIDITQVGDAQLFEALPPQALAEIEKSIKIKKSNDLDATLEAVRKGDTAAAIYQEGNTIVVRYSAADQVKAAQVQGMVSGIIDAANASAAQAPPVWGLKTQQVEDESLTTIQYVTPGMLGWAVAMSAVFGAAVNLVAWRKSGLLRRLRLTPVPTSSVVLARVGVSLVVAMAQTLIFLGVAVFGFDLKLTGWWPLLFPLIMVGTLAFLSIGLLAGSVTKTEEAAVGLANFVVLPMAFLSGSFFPLDGAPSWLQAVSKALPLRHLNDGMLDVMVRGEGPAAIVMPMVILIGFAAVLTFISMRMFRWDA
ncbi:MAG: ABC transporter permease [Actinomycetales bacterium]|nr:ABC transporter permease [Actinomycetales bacterium]